MANIASAEKKNRQMIKHRAANRSAMSAIRTAVKSARNAVDAKATDAAEQVKSAIAIIDKAVSKGLLKKQTGSRYVARLATRGRATN
jgi:small subunit ribosomal protein S20